MLNIEKIKESLKEIGSFENEELEGYVSIIENAAAAVSAKLISADAEQDDRAVMLAAAKANYEIALISSDDSVTSFSAGDLSITQSKSKLENAKALFESISSDCQGILSDSGFAFRTV